MDDNLNNKLPSFLVIGVGKSGTTSLHEYLRQHPRISLPTSKETHFFVLDRSAPPSSLFAHNKLTTGIDELGKYLQEFEPKGKDEIRGEVCPSYIVDANASVNIKRYVPQVKIIAILRNPVERLYSSVNFNNINNDLEILRGVVREAQSQKDIDNYSRDVKPGFYYHLLKRYYALFPRDNIKIYLFDEFKHNPTQVLNDLIAFIGLEPTFKFDVGHKFNPSGKPVLPMLAKFIRGDNTFKVVFRRVVSDATFQNLRVKYQSWMYREAKPLPLDLRQSILSLYLPDVLRLEKLIDRDLSHWRDIS